MPEALLFLFIFGSLLYLLPFVVNYYLAGTRGKNILVMLLLTIPFSYLVTLALAFLPEVEKKDQTTISATTAALFYIILIILVMLPVYRFVMSTTPPP